MAGPSVTAIAVPGVPRAESSGGPATNVAADVGSARSQQESSLHVLADVAEGPGGLGEMLALDAGINRRQAQAESVNVTTSVDRFVRKKPGGRPDIATSVVAATEPFKRRMARGEQDQPGGALGGEYGPRTEKAIELGLLFLSRH